jgi:hypothetical protein
LPTAGPAPLATPFSFDLVIPILQGTKNVFLSGMIATPREGISLKAARACARIIAQAAAVTPDGFTNLRFAALANHAPHGPFFPSAYHAGERPAFALAVECADLAEPSTRLTAWPTRKRLVAALEDASNSLTSRAATSARNITWSQGHRLQPGALPGTTGARWALR